MIYSFYVTTALRFRSFDISYLLQHSFQGPRFSNNVQYTKEFFKYTCLCIISAKEAQKNLFILCLARPENRLNEKSSTIKEEPYGLFYLTRIGSKLLYIYNNSTKKPIFRLWMSQPELDRNFKSQGTLIPELLNDSVHKKNKKDQKAFPFPKCINIFIISNVSNS